MSEPLAHDAVLAAAAADVPAAPVGWDKMAGSDQRSAVPAGVSPALSSPWSSRWLWLLDLEPIGIRRPAAKRGLLGQTAVDEVFSAYAS